MLNELKLRDDQTPILSASVVPLLDLNSVEHQARCQTQDSPRR
jgi:hypothetical protein